MPPFRRREEIRKMEIKGFIEQADLEKVKAGNWRLTYIRSYGNLPGRIPVTITVEEKEGGER